MKENIFGAIEKAKSTGDVFYSGKEGYDIIVFDNLGRIQGSGNYESMVKLAEKHNWGCAYLVPIRFSEPSEEDKKIMELAEI